MPSIDQITEGIGDLWGDITGSNTAIRRQIRDAQKAGISPSLLFSSGTTGANTTNAGIESGERIVEALLRTINNQTRTNAMLEMNEDRLQTNKDIATQKINSQEDIATQKMHNTAIINRDRNQAYRERSELNFNERMINRNQGWRAKDFTGGTR